MAAIGDELEKLFLLQDRPLTKEKKVMLIQEIIQLGFPLAAIQHGLRDMMTQDIKSIKLATIRAAIEEKMVPEQTTKTRCEECSGMGVISMRDDKKYEFALACTCSNSRPFIVQGLVRWNGQDIQFSNGRRLERS